MSARETITRVAGRLLFIERLYCCAAQNKFPNIADIDLFGVYLYIMNIHLKEVKEELSALLIPSIYNINMQRPITTCDNRQI